MLLEFLSFILLLSPCYFEFSFEPGCDLYNISYEGTMQEKKGGKRLNIYYNYSYWLVTLTLTHSMALKMIKQV